MEQTNQNNQSGNTGKPMSQSDVTPQSNTMLTGMFSDRDSVEKAYHSMQSRGYDHTDVDLVMSDDARKRHFADKDTELGTKAMEGAGAGSAIGGTIGAIVGAVAAIGTSLLIPGLGIVVAGPIAAALAGAGAGGLTGGIIGALIGNGIPEERAKKYEEGIKNGHIVMSVRPRNEEDAKYLENEWRTANGQEIYR